MENELVEKFPTNVDFRNALAYSSEKLGIFYKNLMNDPEKALSYFNLAKQIWTKLLNDSPGFEEIKKSLTRMQKELKSNLHS